MRVIESLQELVRANGLIGIMSSGQGSVSNNEKGAMKSIAEAKLR